MRSGWSFLWGVLALSVAQVVPAAPALARGPVVSVAEALSPAARGPSQRQLRRQRELRLRRQEARRLHAELRSIDRFCDNLADLTQNPEQRRLFGLWRDVPTLGKWQEFKDARKLEYRLQRQEVARVAEVWTRDDGAAAIAVTAGGEARDWARFTEYCFRPNGDLARMQSPVDTDRALTERVESARKRYFRATRELVASPAGRPRPNTARTSLAERQHPAYRTLADLPFAQLLQPTLDTQASR